jgi:hypothetical protein
MKLVSGGQSGVDRAVLDVAIERGLDYGGWCPMGGWAEDMTAPPGLLAKYRELKETPLADPAQRTEWNVRDADACVIVVEAGGMVISGGTALAQDLAHRYRRPLLIVDLSSPQSVEAATLWLRLSAASAPVSHLPSAVRAKAKRREFTRARFRSCALCWTAASSVALREAGFDRADLTGRNRRRGVAPGIANISQHRGDLRVIQAPGKTRHRRRSRRA